MAYLFFIINLYIDVSLIFEALINILTTTYDKKKIISSDIIFQNNSDLDSKDLITTRILTLKSYFTILQIANIIDKKKYPIFLKQIEYSSMTSTKKILQ